jgi:hypothetical protein
VIQTILAKLFVRLTYCYFGRKVIFPKDNESFVLQKVLFKHYVRLAYCYLGSGVVISRAQ